MWQSLPTCSGQMTLLPVAALYPGDPERAYRAAWHLAFFDNGFGRDLNAALVAGLAQALVTPIDPLNPGAAWEVILATMRETDPWAFGKIRWTQRSVPRWLDFARASVKSAEGQPARLFATFEKQFAQNHKWEAQVPVVVAFSCLELAEWDPLAALQLCLEWGHDTDSFAQVLGAFVGALHGPGLFRPDWLAAVKDRMQADLHIDWDEECRMLTRLEIAGRKRPLVQQK
jgi:hypothetical protein